MRGMQMGGMAPMRGMQMPQMGGFDMPLNDVQRDGWDGPHERDADAPDGRVRHARPQFPRDARHAAAFRRWRTSGPARVHRDLATHVPAARDEPQGSEDRGLRPSLYQPDGRGYRPAEGEGGR